MTSPARVAQAAFQLPSSAFDTPALVNPGQEPGQVAQQGMLGESDLPFQGSDELMEALEELDASQSQYLVADDFYDGTTGDTFSNARVAELLAKSGLNDMEDFNYSAVPVDTVAEKLQIRAVTVSSGDEASDNIDDAAEEDEGVLDGHGTQTEATKKTIADRAQEWIGKFRKRNQLDAEEDQLHLRSSKYGECYLFVWPVVAAPEEDENAYEGAAPADPNHDGRVVSVDMLVNSPYSTRAFYDAEISLKMTHVVKAWDWTDPDGEKRRRANLFYRDRIERWVTKIAGDPAKREDWIPFIEPDETGDAIEEWPITNPYDRIPFFHFRNDRPYGRPEHRNAYGPQRMINKLIVTHAATVDYQGFPQRFLLIDPKMDDTMMNLINPDNPEDEDDDPEGDGRSQLRSDPAVLWKLFGKSTGQFTAADPEVFLKPLDRYIRSISELTGIPTSRFTGYGQPPSGESRRIENEVLYEKAENRQKSYGATWQDAYEFALELVGITDVEVSVKWKPVVTASGSDDWSTVEKKINLGVPVVVALTEAGYPEDEVEGWLNDETGADLMRRVQLLVQIGTAVQALGAGVGLGVVSAEQVGGIIAKILGATGEALPELEEPVELQPVQAMAQQQAQLGQRGQQVSEHIATAPPQTKNADGSTSAPPSKPLPPMPKPPPPVKVGGSTGA